MLGTVYSLGLRSGELINLKIGDTDGKWNVVTIYNAKGKKDRIVFLSEKLNILLRNYYKRYAPKEYLFEERFIILHLLVEPSFNKKYYKKWVICENSYTFATPIVFLWLYCLLKLDEIGDIK